MQKFEADIGPSRILTEFVPDFNIMLYFETRVAEMHAMLKIQAKLAVDGENWTNKSNLPYLGNGTSRR